MDGLITDCAKVVRRGVVEEGWFDLSTLREPYRVEVFAVGSWRYRVHCDGRAVAATLRVPMLPVLKAE